MRNALKVLIVDDEKTSSQMLSAVVKRLGFKVVVANKPTDALNIVRLQTVHAAIVDVLLPKMTGVELVQEFRKSKFGDNPVVLVSGVFRDRSFASDAIKKTGAQEFLFKPFEVEELATALQNALLPLMTVEKWSVQSLLTRRFTSTKERFKAIEHLEPIKGLDFPYVLSFLLESKLSGNLNLVNDSGEIFGVTLNDGSIADVDSAESQATGVLALISNGFLAQEDWDEYQRNGNKKFSLQRLVEEGYVSPHAVAVAKHEQIIADLKQICSTRKLQLNFIIADDPEELPKYAVRMGELLSIFIFSIEEYFPANYLAEFYRPVQHYPINIDKFHSEIESMWRIEIFKQIPLAKDIVLKGGQIAEMLALYPDNHERVYQCFHLLVISGWIMFDDLVEEKSMVTMLERYKKLYADLKPLPADKIFNYFGAKSTAKQVVNKIFEEYVQGNNPKQIDKKAHPEVWELCNACFELVKQAHETMTDDFKLQVFLEEKKKSSEDNAKLSNTLTTEGLDLLRKGQFKLALQKLKEAEAAHPTTMQILIAVWAEVKSGASRARASELLRQLDGIGPDERRSAYYFMALGLVKKVLGDSTAPSYFEKALQIDPLFVEARRELASATVQKEKKLDIFTSDITQVVSQLFRRKVD